MNLIERLKKETRAWSVCEVAKLLGYSQNYVYELIHSGKIKGWFVINGSYKFCPCKLAEWLEGKLEERNGNGHE